jgi:hypothetical protein
MQDGVTGEVLKKENEKESHRAVHCDRIRLFVCQNRGAQATGWAAGEVMLDNETFAQLGKNHN